MSNQILSQDEVDALLHGIAGDGDGFDGEDQRASPGVRSYDISTQEKIVRGRMPNLEIVHVLQQPPVGWRGETGRITPFLLHRHLRRKPYERFEYFICGPESLMDAAEKALLSIGVPQQSIHVEQFAPV